MSIPAIAPWTGHSSLVLFVQARLENFIVVASSELPTPEFDLVSQA